MQTEVTSAEWDESISKWIILTNRQDKIKARYLVNSNGPLNRPKLPAIKGVHDFKGHTFHTSRWDYGYTGGSSSGNLTGLKGKKVAVIGTGATAVATISGGAVTGITVTNGGSGYVTGQVRAWWGVFGTFGVHGIEGNNFIASASGIGYGLIGNKSQLNIGPLHDLGTGGIGEPAQGGTGGEGGHGGIYIRSYR